MLYRILLISLFLIAPYAVYGHQDFYRVQDFGNVKVRIKTGFAYEEIKKAWIIGELSHKLCQQMRYKKQVFIDLVHHYVEDCKPDYFLSYDDGSIMEEVGEERIKAVLEGKAVVIRVVSRQFVPSEILRLLEYAIKNKQDVRAQQKNLAYHKNYKKWRLLSIDTTQARVVASGHISEGVEKILATKIYRQRNDGEKGGISYYFQENKYHIFCQRNNKKDSVLLQLDNVYQWKEMPYGNVVLFEAFDTFYFIENGHAPRASAKNIIENIPDYYSTHRIWAAGAYKVFFSFSYLRRYGEYEERIALYRTDKGDLIQNLDAIIDKKSP